MGTKQNLRSRSCEADILGLGWRPGFTYYSRTWRKADLVLGYDKHGAVVVRDVSTGVERSHLTTRSDASEIVPEIPNVFGWDVRVTRKHREKVTA